MAGSARAPPTSMAQKKQRQDAHTSQCRDATANLESHKAQENMHLERCHGAVPFILEKRCVNSVARRQASVAAARCLPE